MVENIKCLQAKVFVRKNELRINLIKTEIVQEWIMNLKEMKRKADRVPMNDIRRFF